MPDAGNHAGARGFIAIHAPGGQLADLEEGRGGVEEPQDAVAGQKLAARNMTLARTLQFTGTPSWVAGGETIQGLVPPERLAEALAADS